MPGGHVYKTEGIKLRFLMVLQKFMMNKTKDKILPEIQLNDKLNAQEIIIHEKVTQPKARYNEATLIKEMETLGIVVHQHTHPLFLQLRIEIMLSMKISACSYTPQGIFN